jgi:cell division transport system permease protein
MTIYLKDTTTRDDALSLVTELRKHKGIERVDYLTPEQTLQEFQERSGFADALAMLPENPLPAVIVVHPKAGGVSNEEMAQWAQQLQRLPKVDLVQLDQEWLQRLAGLIKVADRGIWILAGLLIVAVALIIGNTIRLMIQNRQDEIELIDIMGATRSFVRRPFLYLGVLFGLAGGLLSCILVSVGLLGLKQPVAELANLYNSAFLLSSMNLKQIAVVLLFSTAAGWISAYVVVTHYLISKLPKE